MTVEIVHADCRDHARSIIESGELVDAIVCDPPYALTQNKKGGTGVASVNLKSPYGRARIGTGVGPGGFMGQAWDAALPGVERWSAIRDASKPGAHLAAFGGTRKWHRLACEIEDAGWEIRDTLAWMYGQGFPKSLNLDGDWAGWGTALKPAFEPIVLARKPLDGTVAQNAGAHGTGAIHIDACRIEVPAGDAKGQHTTDTDRGGLARERSSSAEIDPGAGNPRDGLGRWPANVLLDEEAAAMLDEQSGVLTSGFSSGFEGPHKAEVFGKFAKNLIRPETIYADSGGASRFFYVAKATRAERTHAGTVANTHPTVKPVALMRWLVRLVTPKGGRVWDPFCGSGTTLVACQLEGFDGLGTDADPASVEIARARCMATAPLMVQR